MSTFAINWVLLGDPEYTALHLASYNQLEIVRMLLAAGADVRVKDKAGDTPLHKAAFLNNLKTAQLLLEKGADPDARDEEGQTPLDNCRKNENNSTDAMEKLFEKYRKKKAK